VNQYKVFRHPAYELEAVKQGWSWPAFCFGAFWALSKKLWLLGAGWIAGNVLVALVDPKGLLPIVGGLTAGIVVALNGNEWRERNLISRGYELVDTVTAGNPEGAVALFLKGMKSPPSLPDDVQQQMTGFGITFDGAAYYFQGYRYGTLEEAIASAKRWSGTDLA